MTPQEFQNALRIMHSLDWHEVEDFIPEEKWTAFCVNPFRTAMTFDEDRMAALMKAIERRQPRKETA